MESTFWHCSADITPFARTMSTESKNVFAHISFSSRPGKDASHPQLPPNTPGYGRVNGMNGPGMGHSLPHVRRTTAKPETALFIDVFGPSLDFSNTDGFILL